MPTTLERISITRVPAVEQYLGVARRAWPEASPRELAIRLMEAGATRLGDHEAQNTARVAEIAQRLAAQVGHLIPDSLVEDARAEWPA